MHCEKMIQLHGEKRKSQPHGEKRKSQLEKPAVSRLCAWMSR